MLDQSLRSPKEKLLFPVARQFNISPSLITLLGLVFGLLAVFFVTKNLNSLALVFWFTNRLLDGIDGEVARIHKRQTDLGAYFDIMADLLIYSLLPLALVLANPSPANYIALALLFASYYLNAGSWMYLASLLEKRGQGAQARAEKTSITMPAGFIEGSETIIFYSLFLLFPQQLLWLFALYGFFLVLTIGQRLYWAYRNL